MWTCGTNEDVEGGVDGASEATLLTGGLLGMATSVLFAYVGRVTLRRPVEPRARLAMRMFATWWFSVAALLALLALPTMLWLAEVRRLEPHLVLMYVRSVPIALALLGLVYYLTFLFTGSRRVFVPLALAYAAFLVLTVYFLAAIGPWEVAASTWDVRLVARGADRSALLPIYGLIVTLPVLLASVAYGSLLFRARDASQRYRIALTTLAFLGWFVPVLAGFLFGWTRETWWPLVYQVPGLAAAGFVLAAYCPPRVVQRRLGVRPYDERTDGREKPTS